MSASPASLGLCPHCGLPVPAGASAAPYCCTGCAFAHSFLETAGLDRFYRLRRGAGVPVGGAAERAPEDPLTWLSPIVDAARKKSCETCAGNPELSLTLDVQGIHCAACVWLLDKLFMRQEGAVHIAVNPGVGRIKLTFTDGVFDLPAYLREIAQLGYRTGPAMKADDTEGDDLLVRLGVTAALAMNTMILSLAFYFGLAKETDGLLYDLFLVASFVLSVGAVAVGGPVFFKGAWRALQRGIIHLDLPIALGIALAFLGSAWSFFATDGQSAYFDTLNVFITLMLLGRFVQRRVVEKNQRFLLEDNGVQGLYVRRLDDDDRVQVVPASHLDAEQTLLIAPGELVPTNARLIDDNAALSLAWINGESDPVHKRAFDEIPAGAHNAGQRAFRVLTSEAFSASALHALLSPPTAEADEALGGRFFSRLARVYVVLVLGLAGLGFALWSGAGTERAVEVAVAVLVVTCPCALGLATPLAFELAQARLRKLGVFVRTLGFLERVLDVKKVVFDKTGTLTVGALALDGESTARLSSLDKKSQDALFQMCARSNHPKSRALMKALASDGDARSLGAHSVDEVAGEGLTFVDMGGACWRLGASTSADAGDDVELSKDGVTIAHFGFEEELRHDAIRAIRVLKSQGYDVYMLSGDKETRAQALAITLGIEDGFAHGEMTPSDKADFIADLDDEDTLMLGDGINDAPALSAAHVAGTPAVDRPNLPARADFYLMGAGLGPLGDALEIARATRRTVVRNLALAVVYNVGAVGLALAGVMSPLLCAILMPLSSVVIVAHTAASLGGRGPLSRQPDAAPHAQALRLQEAAA